MYKYFRKKEFIKEYDSYKLRGSVTSEKEDWKVEYSIIRESKKSREKSTYTVIRAKFYGKFIKFKINLNQR